jgi:hypothetical protein
LMNLTPTYANPPIIHQSPGYFDQQFLC